MTKDEAREAAVEASGWTDPQSKLIYREGYAAGYDAAMSRTCEWEFKWVDRFNEPIYSPACDIEWSYERSTFCPNCGGRVVVKEAK